MFQQFVVIFKYAVEKHIISLLNSSIIWIVFISVFLHIDLIDLWIIPTRLLLFIILTTDCLPSIELCVVIIFCFANFVYTTKNWLHFQHDQQWLFVLLTYLPMLLCSTAQVPSLNIVREERSRWFMRYVNIDVWRNTAFVGQ